MLDDEEYDAILRNNSMSMKHVPGLGAVLTYYSLPGDTMLTCERNLSLVQEPEPTAEVRRALDASFERCYDRG